MSSGVTVLYARRDSVYKGLGCDVFDEDRDARNYSGMQPVVAHPPCRAWGQLRMLANPSPGEKSLGLLAVAQVRQFGGVLEHPKNSTLWPAAGLPRPGAGADSFGGWTLPISQRWFGHRAEKMTLLYIVGCLASELPPIPFTLGVAAYVVGSSGRRRDGGRLHRGDVGWRPEITKAEREATPIELARWLVELAARSSVAR